MDLGPIGSGVDTKLAFERHLWSELVEELQQHYGLSVREAWAMARRYMVKEGFDKARLV